MSGPTPAVRQSVLDRDLYLCARCGRYVFNDPYAAVHHRRPRSSGGAPGNPWINLPANLVLLCGDCHTEVESRREDAYRDGFLVRMGARPSSVPIKTHRGWLLLDDDASFEEVSA